MGIPAGNVLTHHVYIDVYPHTDNMNMYTNVQIVQFRDVPPQRLVVHLVVGAPAVHEHGLVRRDGGLPLFPGGRQSTVQEGGDDTEWLWWCAIPLLNTVPTNALTQR